MRESAAVHEAGHIFMAGYLGIKIKRATWEEVDLDLETPFTIGIDEQGQKTVTVNLSRLDQARRIVISAAGIESQKLLDTYTWSGADRFDRNVLETFTHGASRLERKNMWKAAREQVREVFNLDPHKARRIIREIANRILTKGTITQADLDDLQGGSDVRTEN
jgi:hypothetical protein